MTTARTELFATGQSFATPIGGAGVSLSIVTTMSLARWIGVTKKERSARTQVRMQIAMVTLMSLASWQTD
jgi:hypothetical protein